ncbi:MAG: CDP-alcohol phosphatidyltransferase family protein, partial [Clostridiales bacterium]|nr:CDP-alcohol phosphatidyltransferase family protein [Clostridiales bacterium]
MNIPNTVTLSRILLIPIVAALYVVGHFVDGAQLAAGLQLAAALVFVLAAFTDFLDGYLARKLK